MTDARAEAALAHKLIFGQNLNSADAARQISAQRPHGSKPMTAKEAEEAAYAHHQFIWGRA